MIWGVYIVIMVLSMVLFFKSKLPGKAILITSSLIVISILDYSAVIGVTLLTILTFWAQSNKTKSWIGILIILGSLVSLNYFSGKSHLFKLGLSYYGLQNIGVLLLSIRRAPTDFNLSEIFFANVLFPKFIAGPILLPKEIKALKTDQEFKEENFNYGINRIVYGLFKKLVLADNLSLITETVFNHPESEFKALTVIIASLLFTFEMYLDFSAYTDIVLGMARIFNIKLKENFNLPLRSRSVSEYWRKTHISLIDWFTQNFFYYITFKWREHPIKSAIIGISITFILSGIWHGAQIGFLIWGILNAIYLVIEFLGKRRKIKIPSLISWPLVIIFISLANLFFKSWYWANAMAFLSSIISPESWTFEWNTHVWAILGNGWYLEQQFQLTLIGFLFISFFILEKRLEHLAKSSNISIAFISILGLLIFLVGNFNDGADFIYMQF